MGEAQKKKRFHQTYLNINPYAFPGTSLIHPYYPFPYPDPNFKELNIPKNNIVSSLSNGILTPLESSVCSSSSVLNSPQTPKPNINHINPNEIATPTSLKENESLESFSFSSSPIESPASPSSSSVSSLPSNAPTPQPRNNNNNIENSSSYLDLMDDDVEFYSSSSSSSSSLSPTTTSNQSTISSYFSKVNFLSKFTNGKNINFFFILYFIFIIIIIIIVVIIIVIVIVDPVIALY